MATIKAALTEGATAAFIGEGPAPATRQRSSMVHHYRSAKATVDTNKENSVLGGIAKIKAKRNRRRVRIRPHKSIKDKGSHLFPSLSEAARADVRTGIPADEIFETLALLPGSATVDELSDVERLTLLQMLQSCDHIDERIISAIKTGLSESLLGEVRPVDAALPVGDKGRISSHQLESSQRTQLGHDQSPSHVRHPSVATLDQDVGVVDGGHERTQQVMLKGGWSRNAKGKHRSAGSEAREFTVGIGIFRRSRLI